MKIKTIIIRVLHLDEENVELVVNTIINKKSDLSKKNLFDLREIQKEYVMTSPKAYTIVVNRKFYDENNLNIGKYIDIEITPG